MNSGLQHRHYHHIVSIEKCGVGGADLRPSEGCCVMVSCEIVMGADEVCASEASVRPTDTR